MEGTLLQDLCAVLQLDPSTVRDLTIRVPTDEAPSLYVVRALGADEAVQVLELMKKCDVEESMLSRFRRAGR